MRHAWLMIGLMAGMSLPAAEAQQPGDWVVATETAGIKVGSEVLETVPSGMPLQVREVRGDWLAVANGKTGWIHRRHVLPLEEAIERFTVRIEGNPDDQRAYVVRGVLFNTQDEYNKAITDFTRAIRLNGKYRAAYANRAIAWTNKDEYELAVEDYTEAIQLDPGAALTWHNRGHAWALQGKYHRAVRDFREAIRQNPDAFDSYNALAWLQATCPDAEYRDGQQAVKNALKACDLCNHGHWYCSGTLAAAYAEAGDFEQAVAWERKCLQEAPPAERPEVRRLLDLYQAQRPYRDGDSPMPLATAAGKSSASGWRGRPR